MKTLKNEFLVLITEEVAFQINDHVQPHCPGYIFWASEEKSIFVLEEMLRRTSSFGYSITEEVLVNECLDLVDGQNIEDTILLLQGYGTYRHTKPQTVVVIMDQKARWDDMILASD